MKNNDLSITEFTGKFFHSLFVALNISEDQQIELLRKVLASVQLKIEFDLEKSGKQADSISGEELFSYLYAACLDIADAIVTGFTQTFSDDELQQILDDARYALAESELQQ